MQYVFVLRSECDDSYLIGCFDGGYCFSNDGSLGGGGAKTSEKCANGASSSLSSA